MKRTVMLLTLVVALALSVPCAGESGFGATFSFIGFWQGVDPSDGSSVFYSLTDNDNDRVFEITGGETFFTACNGDGAVTGKGVVAPSGTLLAELLLRCRPGPQQSLAPATFEPVVKDDLLILVVPADDPATLPIVLHRMSRR